MSYIINQQPNLNIQPLDIDRIKELQNVTLSCEQVKQLMDTIAYQTRIALQESQYVDILTHPLTGFCIEATNRICYSFGRYFDIMHYRAERLFDPYTPHSFAVAHLETETGVERYIIDVTYRQFCVKNYTFDNQNVILPGHFFPNLEVLKSLLKDGYLKVTKDSLVAYGSSFVLAGEASRRHGKLDSSIPTYEYEEYSETLETGRMLTKTLK